MTTNYLQQLRHVSAHQAWASNRLGRGKVLHCVGQEDATGHLTLQRAQAPEPTGQWLHLETAAGPLCLDSVSAEPLLNQLSDVPFVIHADSSEQDWYIQLYNQRLSSAFDRLFGYLKPVEQPRNDEHAVDQPSLLQTYLLSWRFGDDSGHLAAALRETTLERLLDRAQWQDASWLDVSDLPLTTPLCLGRLQLEKDDIRGLGIGDVVIPTQPIFSTEGEGVVQLARVRLQLRYRDKGTQAAYQVTHLETATEDAPLMHDDHDMDTRLTTSNSQQESASIDMNIPPTDTRVTLSLQAGEISLSLKELAQLQEGSVLVATGESAGYATLYHHRRPIARGELVEVEGRLGLQLTQVLLPPQVTDHSDADDTR